MGEESPIRHVNIFLNGKRYEVPFDLTIMDAIEYAGFRFIRGSGCRQGMCGACATFYRVSGDYRLRVALACQELVRDGMQVFIVPYSPAKKTIYNFKEVRPSEEVLVEFYPEIARCVGCNTCTKACPQDLEVMEYVQAAIRGDFERVAELSFECIECGLCAIRCPAEIVPYYVARLARRIYAKYIVGLSERVEKRRKEIEEGMFDEELEKMSKMDVHKLRELYSKRDFI
ncbi:MAG: 4Fe-4S dicluster domain-containing protein [Candidatus Bathyarchaeia archaeon]